MKRRGFTLIEIVLVLIILALLSYSYMKLINSQNLGAKRVDEKMFETVFKSAVGKNFKIIVEDGIKEYCVNDNSWGYENPACSNTSPFPTFVGSRPHYDLGFFASMSDDERNLFAERLANSFGRFCKYDNVSDSGFDLLCSIRVTDIHYKVDGSVESNPKSLTENQFVVPDSIVMELEYDKDYGNYYKKYTVALPLDYIVDYGKVKNIETLKKYIFAMEDFFKKRMTREFLNVPPTGLNSNDDEFVLWNMLLFGNIADTTSPYTYPLCDRGGGDTCSNLSSYWISSNIDHLNMTNSVVNKFDFISTKDKVDAFGNPIFLFVDYTKCTDPNIRNCTVSSSDYPLPQIDYYSLGKLPYSGMVFVGYAHMLDTDYEDYERQYIKY